MTTHEPILSQPIIDRNTAAGAAIYVNGRFRVHSATGLQRYAEELLGRIHGRVSGRLDVVQPGRKLTGLAGHAWEQFILPSRTRGLLWSPCNTGPVAVRRQIVTIHDLFPLDHPEWFAPNFVRCYRAVVPRLMRRVQRLIAVSEYTKSRMVAAVPEAESKITVIHSGIGKQFHPQSLRAIQQAAHETALPSRKYVLSVSSVEPRKNVARILQAWQRALPHLPHDLWLVMAGKQGKASVFGSGEFGPLPERVRFTGYVPDNVLPGLYAGAQAFLFPSLAEGFGFPPLEAMACGVPVLTSDTSSLIEVCGGAASLVDPLDVDAIAKGLVTLVRDGSLRRGLRERGLARARQFSWDTTARTTANLIENEIHSRERRPLR
ncbi:MAG TPA: glycosyltransferase family 1 protein [Bryobacteraceae bacterium]|jgi:glycosyltransferase involved in cell wall biosynthesis